MTHPVLEAADAIDQVLKGVADVNPTFMDTGEKATALGELARLEARVVELRLRILAEAGDVADLGAARDAAAWLAHHTHGRLDEARADLTLAHALDRRYPALAAAMRAGEANRAQAQTIVRALDHLSDHLPDSVPADLVDQAEQALVGHAADFGPRQLARLGRRILDAIAPEIAEAAEGRRLADLETHAAKSTRLTLRRLGDGTTRLTALIPDAAATRLATYLEAFTNPRRDRTDTTGTQTEAGCPSGDLTRPARLPHPRKLGTAFCQLLETIDPTRLPLHGGDSTTLIITVPLETLRADLGTGDILGASTIPGPDPTLDTLTAGQIRRLACTAGIIPAVLGGNSEVLDLGRRRRLYGHKQRRALLLTNPTCRAEGCDIPGQWCDAHHLTAWAAGGHTDLAHGVLLCPHHHHRAHDNTYRTERLPNGDIRYHRRT